MLSFKFALLAMLSYVAMISATPFGNGAPDEAIGRRQEYAPSPLTTSQGGSDPTENISPAQPPLIAPKTFPTKNAISVLQILSPQSAKGSAIIILGSRRATRRRTVTTVAMITMVAMVAMITMVTMVATVTSSTSD
jgi:hypothetical protein